MDSRTTQYFYFFILLVAANVKNVIYLSFFWHFFFMIKFPLIYSLQVILLINAINRFMMSHFLTLFYAISYFYEHKKYNVFFTCFLQERRKFENKNFTSFFTNVIHFIKTSTVIWICLKRAKEIKSHAIGNFIFFIM